jgi:hypothetical protein
MESKMTKRVLLGAVGGFLIAYATAGWAQINWFGIDQAGDLPSCDRGADWLFAHSFTVCHRVRVSIIDENCVVSTMECTVIPRPL